MNCKYCGHALPSKGLICRNCGKTMDMEQIKERQNNKLENWDEYSTKNTVKYKMNQHKDKSVYKGMLFILVLILIIILVGVLTSI